MKEIILASQSPRRKELLGKIVTDFICEPADIDEGIDESFPIEEEIKRLATQKAETVLKKHPDSIVVGSDTVVVIDGKVLGKPVDQEDARRMLESLSGKTHEVITGICVMSNEKIEADTVTAQVHFASLSKEEINEYLSGDEWCDKAGAYAIQGKASVFIEGITGDYYCIMGLPVRRLYEMLKSF